MESARVDERDGPGRRKGTMGGRMLEGERVRLRELRRSDLPVIVEHYNDEDVVRFLAFWDGPFGEDDAEAFYERNLGQPRESRALAVERLEDGAFLGTLGLHRVSWRERKASLGVALWDPGAHDKGHGTEALGLLLVYAFDVLNMHRVELTVFAYNERAIRVYEKLGFVQEGRRRDAWYWDGEYHDVWDMGLLRPEWEKLRQA